MKYLSTPSATAGFTLQPFCVKEQWGAAQRRTDVTPFLGKGGRGMVVTFDEESFR